jgi:hypothetical protein
MRFERRCWLILLPGLFLLAGCVATQRVTVDTDPVGAEVFLQRRGQVEMKGGAHGIYAEVDVGSFEEEEFSLGTAPVDYEFDMEEREALVAGPRAGGSVTRRYVEGTLRIVMRGFVTVVRRVRFDGGRLNLFVPLEPARGE